MKRFCAVVLALLTVFAVSAVVRADGWRVTVTTGPETRTIVPLDSTSFLRIEDFTVSSLAQVSSLSFNSSVSELSFKATVSASAASASETNTNITLPPSIVENQSLIVNVSVDGRGNGYMVFEPSTLGFVLSEGEHTVTLNIGIDPPASAPEFSMVTIPLLLIMLTSAVIILKERNACQIKKSAYAR